jgi:hypothetical protein
LQGIGHEGCFEAQGKSTKTATLSLRVVAWLEATGRKICAILARGWYRKYPYFVIYLTAWVWHASAGTIFAVHWIADH